MLTEVRAARTTEAEGRAEEVEPGTLHSEDFACR